jgi:hypothetical protein
MRTNDAPHSLRFEFDSKARQGEIRGVAEGASLRPRPHTARRNEICSAGGRGFFQPEGRPKSASSPLTARSALAPSLRAEAGIASIQRRRLTCGGGAAAALGCDAVAALARRVEASRATTRPALSPRGAAQQTDEARTSSASTGPAWPQPNAAGRARAWRRSTARDTLRVASCGSANFCTSGGWGGPTACVTVRSAPLRNASCGGWGGVSSSARSSVGHPIAFGAGAAQGRRSNVGGASSRRGPLGAARGALGHGGQLRRARLVASRAAADVGTADTNRRSPSPPAVSEPRRAAFQKRTTLARQEQPSRVDDLGDVAVEGPRGWARHCGGSFTRGADGGNAQGDEAGGGGGTLWAVAVGLQQKGEGPPPTGVSSLAWCGSHSR